MFVIIVIAVIIAAFMWLIIYGGNANKTDEENTLISDIRNALEALGVINQEQTASKVLDLLKADPGMPLDKAAFLAANNLSESVELGEIIHKISEHEFSLHENLKSLENGIMNALSKMDPKEGTALLQPLLVKQTLEELAAELQRERHQIELIQRLDSEESND